MVNVTYLCIFRTDCSLFFFFFLYFHFYFCFFAFCFFFSNTYFLPSFFSFCFCLQSLLFLLITCTCKNSFQIVHPHGSLHLGALPKEQWFTPHSAVWSYPPQLKLQIFFFFSLLHILLFPFPRPSDPTNLSNSEYIQVLTDFQSLGRTTIKSTTCTFHVPS